MNIEFNEYIIRIKSTNNLHKSIVQHFIDKKEIPGYEVNYFINDKNKEKIYLERNKSNVRFNLDKNYVIVDSSITFFNLKQHSSIKFKFQIS